LPGFVAQTDPAAVQLQNALHDHQPQLSAIAPVPARRRSACHRRVRVINLTPRHTGRAAHPLAEAPAGWLLRLVQHARAALDAAHGTL